MSVVVALCFLIKNPICGFLLFCIFTENHLIIVIRRGTPYHLVCNIDSLKPSSYVVPTAHALTHCITFIIAKLFFFNILERGGKGSLSFTLHIFISLVFFVFRVVIWLIFT